MTAVSIMVVSDIHADEHREPEPNHSYVLVEPPRPRLNCHPLNDLFAWVNDNNVTADFLVAPGDISNQGNADGLEYAWTRLADLATLLGAQLIGAPGNHDVVTRKPVPDPRAGLKKLEPPFPSGDRAVGEALWRDGWVVLEWPDCRFLVLDSTVDFPAFPEGASEGSDELAAYHKALDRGSFPEAAEYELERYFAGASEKLNVLVVHHHPVEHQLRSEFQDGYGPMHRGSDLIDLLGRHPNMGRWLVLHGHKHMPQLIHAVTNTGNGPSILCAASLGHRLWDPINSMTRNQFHLLEVTNDPVAGLASLRGSVRSFAWGFGNGWDPASRKGSGLPANSGFGCTDDFRTLGAAIVDVMNASVPRLEYLLEQDLMQKFPQLRYQLPLDRDYLQDFLEVRGFKFMEDRSGTFVQVGRVVT